jgi:hypothetical protein
VVTESGPAKMMTESRMILMTMTTETKVKASGSGDWSEGNTRGQ